jgi:hypothetical protein
MNQNEAAQLAREQNAHDTLHQKSIFLTNNHQSKYKPIGNGPASFEDAD